MRTMRESRQDKAWIDLYRDNTHQLLTADKDEPFPEYEGLEVIPTNEPAACVIEFRVYSTREPRSIDPPYPGHCDHEFVLERAFLEVGYLDTKTTHQLPQGTQDALWELVQEELR